MLFHRLSCIAAAIEGPQGLRLAIEREPLLKDTPLSRDEVLDRAAIGREAFSLTGVDGVQSVVEGCVGSAIGTKPDVASLRLRRPFRDLARGRDV